MKKVIDSYSKLIVFLVLCSCGHELKTVPYIHYVQEKENGLKKTVTVADWEYTVQYKPDDYMILQENKGSGKDKSTAQRKKDLQGTAWFNISFRMGSGGVSPLRYNLDSKEAYDQRLNYFLNEAVHDIRLVYGGRDTLHPMSYLFENNYNLTPQETMVVGFSLPEGHDRPKEDMQLTYNDEVFRNGIIKVVYKKEDLNNIPKLSY